MYRKEVCARLEVLTKSDNVYLVCTKVVERLMHFFWRFSQTKHERGFCEDEGVQLFHVA